MDKGVSMQQINLELQNDQLIQQTFFDQFAQPEQPQFLHEPVELASFLEPEQPRILNSKEDDVLNDIKNGKVFFHSLAPTSTIKRKDAASIFSIILSELKLFQCKKPITKNQLLNLRIEC
jgi:hypothetical protein